MFEATNLSRLNHRVAVLALAASVLLGIGGTGKATLLISSPGAGSNLRPSDTTIGFDFTLGSSSILVSSLGVWDQGQNGLLNAHEIGLWSSSGVLLASGTVPGGTSAPLTGQFRFVSLSTPVTLVSGLTYVLGASYASDNIDLLVQDLSGVQASFDSAVIPGNYRSIASAFSYPSGSSGAGAGVGPNLQFTVVPEPSSTALALGGIGLLVGMQRFRSRRKA